MMKILVKTRFVLLFLGIVTLIIGLCSKFVLQNYPNNAAYWVDAHTVIKFGVFLTIIGFIFLLAAHKNIWRIIMNKFFVLFCIISIFGINGCKDKLLIKSPDGPTVILGAKDAVPNVRNYISVLNDNDIAEAKKAAEDYYINITASYKNKITAIRLDADMSNSLWAVHGYGDDLNPDAERFPAGNLVVFYVDTTVEGMAPRGIALGRENVNTQWKVVNEGL